MKAILKYGLETGMNTLQIPGGLFNPQVQHQPGQQHRLQLWTLADTSKEEKEVTIYVTVTGVELPDHSHYHPLGTVQLNGGGVVLHALLATKKE